MDQLSESATKLRVDVDEVMQVLSTYSPDMSEKVTQHASELSELHSELLKFSKVSF